MKLKVVLKTIFCTAAAAAAVLTFGINAFSLIDDSVGEDKLINNEDTPYKVNIVADGVNAAVVPIGIGFRGDADSSGGVSLYDAIRIAEYMAKITDKGYEDTIGFAMADTNLDGKVDLYDAINVAKYLITSGTHDEKWEKILAK
ncbi:MAG: dockerin type I domain-containing protein [Clostridium sp.]|nr:dockerin type I domain-containing protein [Clostridium sp.]MCM1547479.1 dockerin type I domain-containing protein [Ruminococcus sp.]